VQHPTNHEHFEEPKVERGCGERSHAPSPETENRKRQPRPLEKVAPPRRFVSSSSAASPAPAAAAAVTSCRRRLCCCRRRRLCRLIVRRVPCLLLLLLLRRRAWQPARILSVRQRSRLLLVLEPCLRVTGERLSARGGSGGRPLARDGGREPPRLGVHPNRDLVKLIPPLLRLGLLPKAKAVFHAGLFVQEQCQDLPKQEQSSGRDSDNKRILVFDARRYSYLLAWRNN